MLKLKEKSNGKLIWNSERRKISELNPAKYNPRELICLICKKRFTSNKICKSRFPKEWNRGKNHPNWQGGITPINLKIRNSLEMKEWRREIFERDNYICQICRQKGGKLRADHIKPFAFYPELRFNLSNGRTICKKCDLKSDTYGGRATKNRIYSQFASNSISNSD